MHCIHMYMVVRCLFNMYKTLRSILSNFVKKKHIYLPKYNLISPYNVT